ncbi:MAG: hypothetical protein ACXABC_11115, partial [Candidatus Thorarchaeota archaeon]
MSKKPAKKTKVTKKSTTTKKSTKSKTITKPKKSPKPKTAPKPKVSAKTKTPAKPKTSKPTEAGIESYMDKRFTKMRGERRLPPKVQEELETKVKSLVLAKKEFEEICDNVIESYE